MKRFLYLLVLTSFPAVSLLTACGPAMSSGSHVDANMIGGTHAAAISPSGSIVPHQTEEPYTMILRYMANGKLHEAAVQSGLADWFVMYDDKPVRGMLRDALSSLDAGPYLHVIDSDASEVEIGFALAPDSLTVRRWPEEYMGKAFEYYDSYEPVEVSNYIITLSNGGEGYVYDVRAQWSQGYAHYGFRVAGDSAAGESELDWEQMTQ